MAVAKTNKTTTLDEIISEARLDYTLGKYQSFTNAADLIAELHL